MRNFIILAFLSGVFILSSCTGKISFENTNYWQGHWQQMEDTSLFFSAGTKAVGRGEIITHQYFFSSRDTIFYNFLEEDVEDSNQRKNWKLMKMTDGNYIKIQEIDEFHIEVSGPSSSVEGLGQQVEEYMKMPEDLEPPFPDSILFMN